MLAVALLSTLATTPEIDLSLAERYFQEAQWISDDDGGKLWGQPLIGPMVFVEPATRSAATNQRPPDASFTESNGVWTGKWPSEMMIANTALDWKGERWTMVMWPLPMQRTERAKLLAHELFHRIQPDLGLVPKGTQNAHMDTMEGRLWLRVELNALAKALSARVEDRTAFIKDALAFRAYRQSLFEGSKLEEDPLEINEGLAEFTGIMLKGGWEPEARMWQGEQLRQIAAAQQPAYSRRFAYWTGSAYALLLNVEEAGRANELTLRSRPKWRSRINASSSLAGELASVIGWTGSVTEEQAVSSARRYGYEAILNEEQQRDQAEKKRIADYRAKFVEGPVLVLPNVGMNFSFDPNDVFALGDSGSIYGTATISDAWGTLSVTGGVLIAKDFTTFRVPAPTSTTDRSGPGWSLDLKPGWRLVEGSRKGDLRVERTS